MNHQNMRDEKILTKQYKNSKNLDIRQSFHQNYGTNPIEYKSWIRSKMTFFKGCRILELGCGTGSLWRREAELIDSFSELVLSDISEGMVEETKKSYAEQKNVTCEVFDILDISYPEDSFDIIIADSMLYHVPNLEQALKNIHRILKKDGIFYATTFSSSEGLINYINHALYEMRLSATDQSKRISFSLENGSELLSKYFSSVKKELYIDDLEVTKSEDIVKYILSMSSMLHVDVSDRAKMLAYFESQKDSSGVIKIPKLYGMFILKNKKLKVGS